MLGSSATLSGNKNLDKLTQRKIDFYSHLNFASSFALTFLNPHVFELLPGTSVSGGFQYLVW